MGLSQAFWPAAPAAEPAAMRRGEDATHFLVHRLNVEPLDRSHCCESVASSGGVALSGVIAAIPVRACGSSRALRCPLGVPLLYSVLFSEIIQPVLIHNII